jgi:hypothetical protein
MALAEPPFMLFLLSTLLGMVSYTRKPQLWLLPVCGEHSGCRVNDTLRRTRDSTAAGFDSSYPKRAHRVGVLKRAVLVGSVALLPHLSCDDSQHALSQGHPRAGR